MTCHLVFLKSTLRSVGPIIAQSSMEYPIPKSTNLSSVSELTDVAEAKDCNCLAAGDHWIQIASLADVLGDDLSPWLGFC